jgi:hypothetical protein
MPITADAAWYSASWTYRIKITVEQEQVPSDLTDFPVYVSLADLSSDFHTNVKSDGCDIRVTTSDGSTEVPIDLVFYTAASDTGELYFKGSIDGDTDTDFYIYYGNSGASCPAENTTYGAQNTWKSAYTAVYHLQEAVNNNNEGYKDSTSNNRDADGVSMALTAPAGKLAGLAQDFDGGADYINTEETLGTLIANSTGTVTAWASTDSAGATVGNVYQGRWVWSNGTAGGGHAGVAISNTDGTDKIWSYNWDGSDDHAGTTYSTGTWYHIAWRHTGGTLYNYQNTTVASISSGNTSDLVTAVEIGNGYSFSSTPFWDGKIDELRFSNTDLGADWITTEYNNTNSPSTFYTDSAQETNPWDLIATATAVGISGATTASIDTTGADLLIIVATNQRGETATPTDSKSNTWTALTASQGTTYTRSQIFYTTNPTVGSGHTFTLGGVGTAITVMAWSGADTSSPYDVENGANGSASTIQPGTVTPSQNNSLVIAGLSFDANSTPTINSSFTRETYTNYLLGTNYGNASAYLIQDTLAATNPTWSSIGVFGDNATRIAVFKPAGTARTFTLKRPPNNFLGLIARYTFDGGDMTSNVADSSGSGNNGYLVGQTSTTTVIGKLGQALSFDGSNDVVSAGNAANLQISNGTISAWIKTSAAGSSYRGIVTKQNAFGMFLKDNVFMMYDWGGGAERSSGVSLNDNSWHHVACSFQSGVASGTFCYVDGVLSLTTTITVSDQDVVLEIGNGNEVNQYFAGLIDDPRVYNRALSASEIKQLAGSGLAKANTGSERFGRGGLVGHWTFNGQNMTSNVADSSGSGNNGYLVGQTSTTTVIGKLGQALSFDGINDYVSITDNDNLTVTSTGFTVAYWVKLDTIPAASVANRMFLLGKGNPSNYEWDMAINSYNSDYGKFLFHLYNSDGSSSLYRPSLTSPQVGVWYHVVATLAGASSAPDIYINGVLDNGTSVGSVTASNAAANIYLGARTDLAENELDGTLDDVRIYSRTLTASEVKKLYLLGQSKVRQ